MALIRGLQDTLNAKVSAFEQTPLKEPLFLNSVPKGGTHLIRNILRMFVPVAQHHDRDFVQIPNLHQHVDAFNPHDPKLSCGHLLFSDQSVAITRTARHILLVRDPYDWVLARARFFVSQEFDQPNIQHLKSGIFSAEALLNMMIFGIHQKSPALIDIFTHNAAAWLGTGVTLVRYEDIVEALGDLESRRSEEFFQNLLDACGVTRPDDWRERVRIGSDRKQSRTARENLSIPDGVTFPTELPDMQKRLVEVHAPGLRALLGYA
ncbi:hypothetical protein IWC96_01470 [Brevundimonas sp. BAL450]|uniref:Sulfotransferase domain-containing protein n=1 Tax=Brevundimonas abyssalis TAR-001 TaxID=1391729 RepID=A0A8E0TR90_9CAUL|nr:MULTISPECIES: hypothetical protein [Brevundimonas]MBG7613948.1 hypothetical protein [Brevundimonas sp. BAL450]GAD59378.1 hypothetical protein MBEBAB_1628 [Brevundimonas abyssalis TAR-001]